MDEKFTNDHLELSSLPELEELDFVKHPVRFKKYQLVLNALIWIWPLIALVFIWIFVPKPWPIIPTSIIGLFLILSLIGIPIGYNRRAYVLRERDLTYKKGWIFFSTVTIPFNRIQHTEVSQGPIESKFEISSLKIFTAGGATSDLSIPGLDQDEAQRLRDYIAKKASIYA